MDPTYSLITFNVNLEPMLDWVGVRIETMEGAFRTGKLTRINYKEVNVGGKICRSPETLELNNDVADFVSWAQIKTIQQIKA